MRLVATLPPFVGLLNPVVPLLQAARSAGHEVLVLTSGRAVRLVRDSGLPVADSAPGRDPDAEYAEMERKRPPGPPQPGGTPYSFFSDEMADDAVAICREWQPDLVVAPPLAAFGHLVAAALDRPLALHTVGFGHGIPHIDRINDAARPAFERHGTAPAPIARTLDIAPPSMVRSELPNRAAVQYIPYNGSAEIPEWMLSARARPRIAVTLGTIQPHIDGLGPLGPLLEAASVLDAEFVLALGDVDPAALGETPANVRCCAWLPWAQLLQHSDVAVHHGGAGTTLTALRAGVPQVILGQGADRPANAAAVQERGSGLVPADGVLDAEVLRRALEDEQLRGAAVDVVHEITAQPTPAEAIDGLRELAAR